MNRYFNWVILLSWLMASCNNGIDFTNEEKTIRNLLQQERKAHFDRNVDLFMKGFPDNMISVNKGVVSFPSKEQFKERFGKYFASVEFIKWDDMAAPVIRFSDDASLAYAVVQKQVILSYIDSLNKKKIDTTDFAWVTIYRKQKGEWIGEANISTNK